MKITALFILLFIITISFHSNAQEDVDLNLMSKDTASLNIIRVYPDEFPKVSIVFNAATNAGQPIWNLSRKQVQIYEGATPCAIHCLKRISENKAVKLGLVIDHSGSMATDYDQLYDKNHKFLGTYGSYGQQIPPKGYVTPLDNAKKAVKGFINSMDNDKDFIQVIGFSEKVDRVVDFSNDRAAINKQISKMRPSSTTAFYDAIKVALENIEKEEGIKVVIALSDGGDNSSTTTMDEVIALAKSMEVPIYTIALGQADQSALSKISTATGGDFHYTKSSKTLIKIYDNIAKKILSIYELGYTSENLASDAKRDFKLVFDIDSIYLTNNDIEVNLPATVVEHLKQKEQEAAQRLYTYSGMGIAVILLTGGLVFLFRKRKEEENEEEEDATSPVILKSFPNPFQHSLNVEYTANGNNPTLTLTAIDGSVVFSQAIDASSNSVLLQNLNLEKGIYMLNITTTEGRSNAQKVVRM